MAVLRSFLFATLFYPGSLFYVLAGLALFPFGSRPLRAVTWGWARYHRLCARWLLGIRTRVEGNIPAEPLLYAGKHQSMYETIELVLLLHEPVVVLKRELADLPLWGRVAQLYGMIPVDRAGGAVALRRMLKAARSAIADGRAIAIFPEGTRVAPGDQPPLQPGFAGLYKALNLPVVPIAIDSGRLWPRHGFVKRPGIITFRFGEPIQPGLPRQEIEARVHQAINLLDDA